ncbi:MAG: ArsR/SmtB family transcription factor [Chloroflexota bacterium]
MSEAKANTVTLHWDIGTAYELLVSLQVLHNPEFHGIRASWAAGIRSRIPAAERKFLEEILPFFGISICWVSQLPEPKDAMSLLWTLRQIPPAERATRVMCLERWKMPEAQVLLRTAEKGAWNQDDFEQIAAKFCKDKAGHSKENLKRFLDRWVRPEEFGEMLFEALQTYQQAFFEEEEKRIAPVLQAGLAQAQELAERLSVSDLLVELSQGVRLEVAPEVKEITIIPAYWTTPLVMWDYDGEEKMQILFGARPATMSAIPGEVVPDGLVRALKAISDPTRLKILRYLSHETLTPSDLARRLHLRAPTLTHHLNELRLAGLVNLDVHGQEKHYATRREALRQATQNLESFLDDD